MEETKNNGFHDYSFSKPAIYNIKIQGRLVESWWDRLGDMEIQIDENPGGETLFSS